jgi:hypothetical protein
MYLECFKKELLTFDLVKLNLYGFIASIPIILIYGIPYYLIWSKQFSIAELKKVNLNYELVEYSFEYSFSIVFIMLLGILIHELIHGITFSFFAKTGFKAINFGVLWKMLTPYCHCKEPLLVKHYIIGGIMPAFILGFLPFMYSLLFGNLFLLIFAIFFTVAAFGDFYIIYLLRNENKNSLVLDHPSEVGCFVYKEKKS